ncbi:MAG: trypsin-like peptidase domain-containing protein, partial [Spirochaetaceae bacterium]|nr:trypsin-like peptidase domain-containing protein [Spirochaetaceae bacterium]
SIPLRCKIEISSNTTEDISVVLEDISILQRSGIEENVFESEKLRIEASGLINSLFTKAVVKKNYIGASNYFLTAEQSGLKIDGEWSYNDLILASVLKDDKSISAAEKSYVIRNYLDIKLLDDSDLVRVFDLIADAGDKSLITKIRNEADLRSIDLSIDLITDNKEISKTDLLKGTVTIWVNRGMKIKGGIGVPDSVIGSGFFIDKEGYLLTNYHVIESEVDPEFEGFSRLYVRLWDDQNTKIPAKVVGWDKIFDIALLKLELEPEMVFSFSQGKKYLPGTPIIAIGSPGGLENTITSGIVSASGRKFLQMCSVIQVDVPINHGNSGGPLIDNDGELVGVVFAGIEQFEGINFAIPGEYVSQLIPNLYKGGRVQHPFLGLAVQEEEDGLRIIYRTPGESGSIIGLQNNDIITSLMGIAVKQIEDVNKLFLQLKPGMAIKIDWIRAGVKMSGIIALGIRPDFPVLEASKVDLKYKLIAPVFGMTINSISENIFGTDYMVSEVFPGSIADITGLSVNDPFSVKKWEVVEEQKLIIMQIKIKKRKAGFLESGVQLGAYMGTTNFI